MNGKIGIHIRLIIAYNSLNSQRLNTMVYILLLKAAHTSARTQREAFALVTIENGFQDDWDLSSHL